MAPSAPNTETLIQNSFFDEIKMKQVQNYVSAMLHRSASPMATIIPIFTEFGQVARLPIAVRQELKFK